MIVGDMEIRLRADIARLQRDMDGARRVVDGAASGISRAADMAKLALASIGMGAGLSQIIRLSDEYAKFSAQLRLASNSVREYNVAMNDVRRIATTAQVDLAATGVLYARIANGTRELGLSQQRVADITETVNLALKVSGATTAEAGSAMLQLSQAFASGVLRGEEFNAVNEAAPRLMKALADGMGVPIGALKQMATDGLITSKIMSDVLPLALAKVREEAQAIQTVGGAFQVLKNNVMEFVGVQSNASGAVSAMSGVILSLANNLGLVTGAIATLMAAKLGAWLASGIATTYASMAANSALATSTLALGVASTEAAAVASAAKLVEMRANASAAASSVALTTARVVELRAAVLAAEGAVALAIATNGLIPAQARQLALTNALTIALAAEAVAANVATTAALAAAAALNAQAAAATLATRAMGVLRGIMAFFGGPIGLIITLLGAAATAWMVWGNKAKDANAIAKETTLEAAATIVKSLDAQIEKHERIIAMRKEGMTLDQAQKALPTSAMLGSLGNELTALNAGTGQYAGMQADAQMIERGRIMSSILELTTKINKEETSGAAAAALTNGEARLKFMSEYDTKAQQLVKKLAEARKAMGTAFTADDEAIIRAAYAEKGPKSQEKQIGKGQLAYDLEEIKKSSAAAIGIYAGAEQIMESVRAGGLVSDADYYASKLGFINLTAMAQEAALQEEITRLQQESLAGKERIDNERKILDATAALDKVRADAVTGRIINANQEAGAIKKIAQSYADAQIAAKTYLDTVARQNEREIAGVGRGTQFRDYQGGINQIEDRQTSARQGLEGDLSRNQITRDQFDGYLAIVNDTYAKEVEAYTARTNEIRALQGDWTVGAAEAFANYQSNAEDVAASSAAAFSSAFEGMTDGFANSVTAAITQGKSLEESLMGVATNVVESFISALIKMAIQQIFINKTAATGFAATIALQSQAMVAMASLNAFASTAAVPIVGPGLAPGAAAAAAGLAGAFAATATLASAASIASAEGGYDIPAGVNPITQLHEQEMVLPRQQADVIRNMAKDGGNSKPAVSVNYAPVINIDSRTDQAEVRQLVSNAVAQGNAQLVDKLQRAGAI